MHETMKPAPARCPDERERWPERSFRRTLSAWAVLRLEKVHRLLKLLSACNKAMAFCQDETQLLETICQLSVEVGQYRMAWIGYAEEGGAHRIVPQTQAGEGLGYLAELDLTWNEESSRGDGSTGRAIRQGEAQLVQHILTDPASTPWREAAQRCGFASKISLPLRLGEQTFGVLSLYSSEPEFFDTEEEVRLLEDLSGNLALTIQALRDRQERDRAREEQQANLGRLKQSLEQTIQVIARMVEMRDPYTAGHERRVAGLAEAIAQAMGLPENRILGLHLAAMVHDLGKLQIPAEILSKPTRLSPVEMMLIKQHAESGFDILKEIAFPWPIAEMVHQHHERMDGSGYPQGLSGEAILLEARIIAVADVVEAMASHRPYRAALGIERALDEIRRGRGTHYDPEVADTCLTLFENGGYTIET